MPPAILAALSGGGFATSLSKHLFSAPPSSSSFNDPLPSPLPRLSLPKPQKKRPQNTKSNKDRSSQSLSLHSHRNKPVNTISQIIHDPYDEAGSSGMSFRFRNPTSNRNLNSNRRTPNKPVNTISQTIHDPYEEVGSSGMSYRFRNPTSNRNLNPNRRTPNGSAFKTTHQRTRYHKPVCLRPEPTVLSSEESPGGDRSVIVGPSGVSYRLPDAPFDFQYSYSETPRAAPIAIREPAFLPFAPPSMPRPWTGNCPICSKTPDNWQILP